MNIEEIRNIVGTCLYPNYIFVVELDTHGSMYLQAHFTAGKWQTTRKWLLSEHMVKSEIVQTVFKCVLTSVEHECREAFTYQGKPIFGPHFDVDSLVEICVDQHLDYRRTG